MAGVTSVENPLPKAVRSSSFTLYAIDNALFIAAAARLVTSPKLKGPYEACIASYGNEERPERVVVSIVDTKRHLVIDHRTWLISEYRDEASRGIEAAVDVLTDDLMDYCERSHVGKVFVIDKPFPLNELYEKCPNCGEDKVRVPWQDC